MTTQTGRLKRILKLSQNIGLVALLLFQFNSCTPDLSDDPIPYVPFSDIVLNLGLLSKLSTDHGFEYVDGGVKGLLIYRQNSSTYIVFERNCSFHPNDACSTIDVHSSTLYIEDSCCKSTFRFPDGEPTGGPAWRPLRRYVTYLDDNELTITDDIIQ